MSPAQIETKSVSRSLASFVDEKPEKIEKPFPRYDELVGKINRSLMIVDKDITKDRFDAKVKVYKEKIGFEAKALKKDIRDKEEISLQERRSQDLVFDLAIFDEELKIIQEKKLMDEETLKLAEDRQKEMKSTVEIMLNEIHKNNELAQKPEEIKKEVVASSTESEKKEVKKEEKKEVAEDKKEEKKEVKRSENPEICALQEQNELLSNQLKELVSDQKKISESLVNLTGALAQMVQGQQRNPWAPFMSGMMPGFNYPQQYPTPQNMGGQWVYMPGVQPVTSPQHMGDQTLMQAMNFQSNQQASQQVGGPFIYNNGLGSNPFSLQLPNTMGQSNLSYDPIHVDSQFQVGTFGQSSQLSNVAYNFSPSSLMVL